MSLSSAISASAFGAFRGTAPGSFIELYGSNLAGRSNQWATFFQGDQAPNGVDTVRVTIGGEPGYVYFISPQQVNVQVPGECSHQRHRTRGSYLPRTLHSGDIASYAAPLSGLLAPPAFNVQGKQYVVALHADNSYVGNGNIPGVQTTPAKPGETITFYGIGFGTATDQNGNVLPLAGQIVTAKSTLVNQVQFQFGPSREVAAIQYDGMAPNYVGLYQFNVTVPTDAANGDVAIAVSLNGKQISQNLLLTVHN